MTFILGESWDPDGGDAGTCPDNYNVEFAREFRYDTARARYLNRELDTEDLMQNPQVYTVVSETWSDYDDDEIHGDFEIESNEAEELRSFEPGIATVDGFASSGSTNTKYYHGDLIGTTRVQSTSSTTTGAAVYTAFGELVSGTNHRYGYAGAWGYESHDNFPFHQVGRRYYDPSAGRFLQRDPLGVLGALNLYAYVDSSATVHVDETGEEKVKTPHGWRDAKTGRFTKPPLWRRVWKWSRTRIPIYACGSAAAAAAHRIGGKPYEDPIDVTLDIIENIGRAKYNDAYWRQQSKQIQKFPKHHQQSIDRNMPWG